MKPTIQKKVIVRMQYFSLHNIFPQCRKTLRLCEWWVIDKGSLIVRAHVLSQLTDRAGQQCIVEDKENE
ncbi:MAG: hypothetical protein K8F52_13750 [Candidatus Scalindua rubra]|nr:hypothetical protein [Candidatus Scalindua rubra]TWU32403.1 hypothetical protein S225a_17950 [Candidatus Brocadiaceae bacterium S225]